MKVLIVDDERLALESLSELIDWPANGYDLVGGATNGAEAMRLVDEFAPDIVISDIRMPVMDGLDLSKMIQEKYPQIKVVLLTAFRDFEYAQQAVRFGVTDYILKNQLNETNLLQLLDRLARDIEKNRANQGALQHNYYQNLLLNIIPAQAAVSGQEHEYLIRVLVKVRIPYILTELTSYQLPEILLGKSDIENLLPAGGQLKLRQLIGLGQASWGILLADGLRKAGTIESPQLVQWLERLQAYFQEHFGRQIAVFFDRGIATPESIKESYQGMIECSKYSLFIQSNQVEPYRRILQRYRDIDDDHEPVKRDIAQITSAIQNADSPGLNAALDAILRYYSTPAYNLARFRYAFSRLIDLLDSIRLKNNLPSIKQHILSVKDELVRQNTAWEIWNWLCGEFYRFAIEIGSFPSRIKDKKIALSLDYIHKNYMHKLTAKGVGDYVGLSEVYFSSLFKKETGHTFLEYLTEHRMNIAKYLIGENKYKIYEIAEMTGYTSPQYFSQIFQKHLGCTPYEYSRKGGHDETKL